MALKPIGIEDDNTFPGRVGTALNNLAKNATNEVQDGIEPIAHWKSGNVSVFGSRTLTSLKSEARRLNLNTVTIPVNINASSATDSAPTLDTAQFNTNKPLIEGMINAGYNVIIEPFPMVVNGTVLETDWNPTDKAAWFTAWGGHLQTIATYAQTVKAHAMYIASNLVHMESDTARWTTVINNVRTVFTGKVMYRTNFWRTASWAPETITAYNDKLNNPLFGLVDVIAIAAYFELTDAERPTKSDLKTAIRNVPLFGRGQDIFAEIKAFWTKWKKPIFFGELGIAPYTGLAAQPWDNVQGSRTLWEPLQANWFDAWYETFGAQHWFMGYSVFAIADGTSTYELINRPAERTVRAHTFNGEVNVPISTEIYMTQAEYTALATKDPNTTYFITG